MRLGRNAPVCGERLQSRDWYPAPAAALASSVAGALQAPRGLLPPDRHAHSSPPNRIEDIAAAIRKRPGSSATDLSYRSFSYYYLVIYSQFKMAKRIKKDFLEDSEIQQFVEDILYPFKKKTDAVIAIQFGVPKGKENDWREAVSF